MPDGNEPLFTVPRSLLTSVCEVASAFGLSEIQGVVRPRILDVGAGVGTFSVIASATWPGARITAYEADPVAFVHLEENARGLPVECRNHAIRDPGTQLFPCDVLKVDVNGSAAGVVSGYAHLADLRALLVVTHDPGESYEISRIASAAGLSAAGRHTGAGGRTTLRFVPNGSAARVDGQRESSAAAPDQPVGIGDRRLHLYVSLLTGGGRIWGEVEHCLHELRALCAESGLGLTIARESTTGVDRARNRQSERFLHLARNAPASERPTHMLQLDDDIVFDPRDIVKLMRSDLDVTAIVYPRKEIDWQRVARAVMAGADRTTITKYESPFVMNFVGGRGIRHPEIGSLLEVEEVGTGCMMIKVEALERYIASYREELEYLTDYSPRNVVHHQVFHCERDPACPREQAARGMRGAALALKRADDAGRTGEAETAALLRAARAWGDMADDPGSIGRYLTEDYSFCRRWRMLGGKIYVLREAELGHIGTHVYRGSLATAVSVDR